MCHEARPSPLAPRYRRVRAPPHARHTKLRRFVDAERRHVSTVSVDNQRAQFAIAERMPSLVRRRMSQEFAPRVHVSARPATVQGKPVSTSRECGHLFTPA